MGSTGIVMDEFGGTWNTFNPVMGSTNLTAYSNTNTLIIFQSRYGFNMDTNTDSVGNELFNFQSRYGFNPEDR